MKSVFMVRYKNMGATDLTGDRFFVDMVRSRLFVNK